MNKNKIVSFCPIDDVKTHLTWCLNLPFDAKIIHVSQNGILFAHENNEEPEYEKPKNETVDILSNYLNKSPVVQKIIEDTIDILNNAEDEQEYNMALHTLESALSDDETEEYGFDLEEMRESYRSDQKVRSEHREEAFYSDELDEFGDEFSENIKNQMKLNDIDLSYIKNVTKWSEYKLSSLLNGCKQYWPSSKDVIILANIFQVAPFRLWPDWNFEQNKKN